MAKGKVPAGLKRYQNLQRAKKSHCEGRISKTRLNEVKTTYVNGLVKSGTSKTEATKKANQIVNGKCSVKAAPKKTKKKSTARRRAA